MPLVIASSIPVTSSTPAADETENARLKKKVCRLDGDRACSAVEEEIYDSLSGIIALGNPDVPEDSRKFYRIGKNVINDYYRLLRQQERAYGVSLSTTEKIRSLLATLWTVEVLVAADGPKPEAIPAITAPEPQAPTNFLDVITQNPVATGEGAPVNLGAEYFGNPDKPIVVVNFFATWCGPCRTEIPYLNELTREHPEVEVIGITSEDPASYKSGEKRMVESGAGPEYPVFHDEDGSLKYGINPEADGIPYTFVFSSDGAKLTEIRGVPVTWTGKVIPLWKEIRPFVEARHD